MSKHQLIVTLLGTDKSGILSEIATAVSQAQCNILDSRQAVYGREFSLTMIIEGSQSAITKAECTLPSVIQRLDLLSMMKRTSHHEKQNLANLLNVEFSGQDAAGLIQSVTGFFAHRDAIISAFRQRTYQESDRNVMQCKFVVSIPTSESFEQLESDLMTLFASLNVTGKVVDKQKKESNENSTSW